MSTITKNEGLLVPANRLEGLEWCLRYLTELRCDCDPDAPGCACCLAARLHRELFPAGPVPDGAPMPPLTPAEALVLLGDAVEGGAADLACGSYAAARRFQALETVRDLVGVEPAALRAEAAPAFPF